MRSPKPSNEPPPNIEAGAIARAWPLFAALEIPRGAAAEQRYEMRRAYFAGAQALAMFLIHSTTFLNRKSAIANAADECDRFAREHLSRVQQTERNQNAKHHRVPPSID